MWRLVTLVLWFSCAVTLRRWLRGPRRPRWTWLLEVLQPVLLGVARWGLGLKVAQMRARIDLGARCAPQLAGTTVHAVQAGTVPAEWFRPSGAPHHVTVLYLHGGAYMCCSVATHRRLITRIAQAIPASVLAINYRLAPEHPFPAALDDAVEAYQWLLAQGVSPRQLVVAGDSAGGGLALALLLRLRDQGMELPACACCFSPWADLAGTGESMVTNNGADYLPPEGICRMAAHYLGATDPRTPGASPLYGDYTGLPPLLIQVGSAEILLDDSRRVEQRARQANVHVELEIYEDMVHVFQAFDGLLPQSAHAVQQAARFVRAHVGHEAGSASPAANSSSLESVE